ncbi:MAG: ribbon-helix-helix domain-containing protein [Saprospiraceae bacterium]|jgi:predicted DNA-binding protein|nr:ribbon-helix-helix domain-containing protein [Saprospiraceae bacterium]HMT76873.1 ribbon-helix-helix domain-containing protein [Saprospiraceae bacterium]HQU96145.1 ribbon-helix-helix domain-containing protein [Saprospiraceae bacterium]
MVTFTSSLPNKTLDQLSELSKKLGVPKNQLINEALTGYFHEIERRQFEASFEKVALDDEMKEMAEIGLEDYVDHLNRMDAHR